MSLALKAWLAAKTIRITALEALALIITAVMIFTNGDPRERAALAFLSWFVLLLVDSTIRYGKQQERAVAERLNKK